jgi:hypothetical protein
VQAVSGASPEEARNLAACFVESKWS